MKHVAHNMMLDSSLFNSDISLRRIVGVMGRRVRVECGFCLACLRLIPFSTYSRIGTDAISGSPNLEVICMYHTHVRYDLIDWNQRFSLARLATYQHSKIEGVVC